MITASLACADYLRLGEDIRAMDRAAVDGFHIDIMDGHYVPNLSFNFDMIKAVRRISDTPMDVHLMVHSPEGYIDRLADCGVQMVCTHLDATGAPDKFIAEAHNRGLKAGFALRADDNIELIAPYLGSIDYLLVMFISPGFSGLAFQPEVLAKVRALDKLRRDGSERFAIVADGGIGWQNVLSVIDAGADLVVAGVFANFNQPQGLERATAEFGGLVREAIATREKSRGGMTA